jgi:hypothetical protein
MGFQPRRGARDWPLGEEPIPLEVAMNSRTHEIRRSEVVIGEIVAEDVLEQDALGELLLRATPWSAQPVGLQPLVTVFLWLLMATDLAVSGWLFSVLRGELGCGGSLCTLATLFGHPALTLGLAAGSCVVLLVTCAGTRAFTRGTAPVLILVTIAAAVALISVLGAVLAVALVVLIAVALLVLAGAVLAALLSRSVRDRPRRWR